MLTQAITSMSGLPKWARIVLAIVVGRILSAIVSIFPGFLWVWLVSWKFGPESVMATILIATIGVLLWIVFGVWFYRQINPSTPNAATSGMPTL